MNIASENQAKSNVVNREVQDQMRAESAVEVYEEMYMDEGIYDRPYDRSPYYPMFRQALEEVKRLGARNFLEVGCGSGSFAQMIIERSDMNYHGFDFSTNGIEKAKRRSGRDDLF